MDIPCPVCGEPWDNDSLHEEVATREADGDVTASYAKVAAEFRSKGCKALGAAFGPQSSCVPNNDMRTQVAGMLHDMLGDDTDGIAAMFEDAEYLFD